MALSETLCGLPLVAAGLRCPLLEARVGRCFSTVCSALHTAVLLVTSTKVFRNHNSVACLQAHSQCLLTCC